MKKVYMDSFTMTAVKDEQLNMAFEPGFTPRLLEVVIGARSGAEDGVVRSSEGRVIGGHLQYVKSEYDDGTRLVSRVIENRIAVVIGIKNGTPHRVIDWEFLGWNAVGPNIRVHKYDTRYRAYFTVWGD